MVALTAPAFYYGFVFGISVGLTVIAPQLLRGIYHFSTEAQGLSYLTVAIGAILGKTAGGWVGDRVVLWKQERTGERHPEYRIFAMVGRPFIYWLDGMSMPHHRYLSCLYYW
jgi:hypothetical protein